MEEPKKHVHKKIQVNVPQNHTPSFSNSVQISVNNHEVVLQFLFVRPNTEQGTLISEIVLTPQHAINLQKSLDNTLKTHFTRHLGNAGGTDEKK